MNRIAFLLLTAALVAPAASLPVGAAAQSKDTRAAALPRLPEPPVTPAPPAPPASSALSTQERAAAAAVFRRDLQRLAEQEQANAAVAHTREQQCLSRFFSAPCLEDLRQDMASKDQDIRLARAAANRGLRELEAIERFQRRAEGSGNAR